MITNIVVSQSTLPILSKTSVNLRFPVHRIYCVGRNYREHTLEMGGDPDREPPFFFHKPADAVVDTTSTLNGIDNSPVWAGNKDMKNEAETKIDSRKKCVIPYPPMTSALHYEGELVIAVGIGGLRIPVQEAMNHVFGYAVGCDLTRRDLQNEAKKKGRPWDTSKGFDFSSPCGAVVPKDEVDMTPSLTTLLLEVNGERRQSSLLDQMIWNVPEIISYMSNYYRLKPGDLVMTGTPAGVSAVNVGDYLKITCGSLPSCEFCIGNPEL